MRLLAVALLSLCLSTLATACMKKKAEEIAPAAPPPAEGQAPSDAAPEEGAAEGEGEEESL
jgi:hypothetical protein